jgi:DNA-directed RNA polymerase subunit beta'
VKEGQTVKTGDMICEWDPFNAVIISEFGGKVAFEHIEEGITFKEESDEQTGFKEKVVIDSEIKRRFLSLKL